MRIHQFLTSLVAVATLAFSDWAAGAVIYQTVALTGQQAPGMAAGTVYLNSFSGVSINSSGQVVFSSAGYRLWKQRALLRIARFAATGRPHWRSSARIGDRREILALSQVRLAPTVKRLFGD